jgi:predicted nucleic acid-binding Zn ribbon protein
MTIRDIPQEVISNAARRKRRADFNHLLELIAILLMVIIFSVLIRFIK